MWFSQKFLFSGLSQCSPEIWDKITKTTERKILTPKSGTASTAVKPSLWGLLGQQLGKDWTKRIIPVLWSKVQWKAQLNLLLVKQENHIFFFQITKWSAHYITMSFLRHSEKFMFFISPTLITVIHKSLWSQIFISLWFLNWALEKLKQCFILLGKFELK